MFIEVQNYKRETVSLNLGLAKNLTVRELTSREKSEGNVDKSKPIFAIAVHYDVASCILLGAFATAEQANIVKHEMLTDWKKEYQKMNVVRLVEAKQNASKSGKG